MRPLRVALRALLILGLRLPGVVALLVAGVSGTWLLAAIPAHAVEIQRVTAGDIEAWLVEDHANPIIAMRIAFAGSGAAVDPAGKGGLARMTSALLDEGAGELGSEAFQQKLEDLAIGLSFDTGLDDFGGSLQTLSQNRDEAFRLLRLALTHPRFDSEPVARIRSQLQAQLRNDDEDPDTVADRTLWATVFPDHPYGRPVSGTQESLEHISIADLQAFAASRLGRDRLVIGVVGDITPSQLAALLSTTFGDLPEHANAPSVPDVQPAAAGPTHVVDMNVPQSAIAFAQPGLRRDDPRFYALMVLDQILGGYGLTSRLFDAVREKRGLVYSVGTGLAPLDHAALILGSAGTANERVAETIRVIREQWAQFAENGISDDELADSKTFLIGSFPMRFAGSMRLASLLATIRLQHLGIDYLNRRSGLIDAVSRNDVNKLARDLLAANALQFIVVGKPADITAPR